MAPPAFIELSFELRDLDVEIAENACFECGATSVTFSDMRDDPVLEPELAAYRSTKDTIKIPLRGEAPIDLIERTTVMLARRRSDG